LLLNDGLYHVVLVLYGGAPSLGLLHDLGDAMSLRFSRHALEAGDYSIAARVVTRIEQVPEGMTDWHWQLQIARLEIFSGQSQVGADRLLRILEDADEVEEQELDRLLQVAFDLQAISRDDLALKVFQAAGPFAHTVRQRRELLFWMGESQIGEGRYAQGADLFLQSSEVAAQQLDLWGQSARIRAAEALVDAGLFQDAFNVYRSLLKESSDENRQLQLRQKLQNLNLLEAVRSE
jgi:tetratricopeptide (TPR) repeat protein